MFAGFLTFNLALVEYYFFSISIPDSYNLFNLCNVNRSKQMHFIVCTIEQVNYRL